MKSEFATPGTHNLTMDDTASSATEEMIMTTLTIETQAMSVPQRPSADRALAILTGRKSVLEMDKIQKMISNLIRGRSVFIPYRHIKGKKFLNIGCGPEVEPEFINLDYFWHPKVDICWDITRKAYPLEDNSLEGIFTEHCLEHISYEAGLKNMKEFYRMLKPGGVVRIIVPDAEIYLDSYQKKKAGFPVTLPYGESEPTAIYSINRIFREYGHQFIYDFETMKLLLQEAGFQNVKKMRYQEGKDARLLVEHEERKIESLYVEAIK
jgi:predicted SAM-dependent methyltransferase